LLTSASTVGIIGFGEAGGIFGVELARRGLLVRSFDSLLAHPLHHLQMRQRMLQAGVDAASSLGDALRAAKLVISAVSAEAAVEVAQEAGSCLAPGQIYLDINAVSPEKMRACATYVQAQGADYVEAALMQPISLQRLATPMMLGGKRAAELAPALNALGLQARAISADIGVVAAISMETSGVSRAQNSEHSWQELSDQLQRFQAIRGELP
jgi:3-hydroxyisobutyrate dehydrogenase-like beta-hydroxyacid dehydrogenase